MLPKAGLLNWSKNLNKVWSTQFSVQWVPPPFDRALHDALEALVGPSDSERRLFRSLTTLFFFFFGRRDMAFNPWKHLLGSVDLHTVSPYLLMLVFAIFLIGVCFSARIPLVMMNVLLKQFNSLLIMVIIFIKCFLCARNMKDFTYFIYFY